MAEQTVHAHRHFTLGTAPYRLVGLWSGPGRALAEMNPSAYQAQIKSKPACCRFECDHCHTQINHHYLIEDARGDRFSVGSSCIDKLGDVELITAAQKLARDTAREERHAARRAEQQRRYAVYQSQLDAQRDINGGLTDGELAQNIADQQAREAYYSRWEAIEPIARVLNAAGRFGGSIITGLEAGNIPTSNAQAICVEILAKQHGRKNSRAYREALPKCKARFEAILEAVRQADGAGSA